MARAMKDPGIVWIGEIPETWKIVRNKNCFYCGKEIVGADSANTQLLSLTTKGIRQKSESDTAGKVPESYDTYQIVKPYDLIMCLFDLDCSAVFSGLSPYYGMISPAYKVLKSNPIILPEYAQFWFSFIFDGRKFKTYAKNLRYTLTYDEFAVLPILLPSVDEQKRIVNHLITECVRIDAVIEQTRASIEEYKKLKQAVITQAVTKGIRPNRPMKDSGIEWLDRIPLDWAVQSIKNIANTSSGGTPNSGDEALYDGDINWVCSYDLREKPIIESGRKITQAGANSIAGEMQPKGSVLIAMYGGSGTIGNSGILECEARTNQAICSVKFNNQFILDYFGFYYIQAIRKHWMIYAVGTRKDPNISQEIVRRMPCVIPPLIEQEEIIRFLKKSISGIDELKRKKEALLQELETYRKAMIYEYVTGKKEVSIC